MAWDRERKSGIELPIESQGGREWVANRGGQCGETEMAYVRCSANDKECNSLMCLLSFFQLALSHSVALTAGSYHSSDIRKEHLNSRETKLGDGQRNTQWAASTAR